MSDKKNKPNIYLTETKDETEKDPSSNSTVLLPPILTSPSNKQTQDTEIEGHLLKKLAKKYKIKDETDGKKEFHPKPITKTFKELNVRSSSYNFLEKTREINRLRYSLQLKQESKNQYEENIKNEIAGIEETMKSMQNYKDNFEKNVTQKYNDYLKKLYSELEIEKNKVWALYQTLNSKRKENNMLESKIRKKENEKIFMEKWIKFQFEVKNGKEPENLKNELKKLNGRFIFENVEDFCEGFTKEEDKNLLLLKNFEKINRSIEELNNEKNELIKTREKYEKNNDNLINEKQKILDLLKARHEKLQKQKVQVILSTQTQKTVKKKKIQSSLNFKLYNSVNFELLHSDTKKNKDLLYSIIFSLYNSIVTNLSNEIDNIVVNFKACPNKYKKMKCMLVSIEIAINYIIDKMTFYHKNPLIYGNQLNQIIKQIEIDHKREKANTLKMIEMKKYKELKDKIAKRNEKIYFVPNKRTLEYPFYLYQGTKKRKSSKDKEKELVLSDFLYESS